MTDNNKNGYSFWADQAAAASTDMAEDTTKSLDESLNSDSYRNEISSAEEETSMDEKTSLEERTSITDEPFENSVDTDAAPTIPDINFSFNETGVDAEDAPVPPAPKKKRKSSKAGRAFRRGVGFITSAAVFGVVAGGAFVGFNALYYRLNPSAPAVIFGRQPNGTSGPAGNSLISSTTVSNGSTITTTDVSDIVDQAMPSLVSISCTFRSTSSIFGYMYEGTTQGSGSGIIVGQNDTELLIATNNHVIDNALTTSVTFPDGSAVDAIVKGTDPSVDLAIVSVSLENVEQSTLDSITVATLGSSDDIKVGQMVIAIGNALGYGQTTTVGYVSAKERVINVTDSTSGTSTTMTALQVDAAINPGNSGGALLNTKGEVIGINSAKLSGTSIEGIGYAIPISNVTEILTELMNREILSEDEQGYLAVYLSATDITSDIAASLGWPTGVYITEVIEGGAAENGGVLAGDIVTAVNGVTMTSSTQLRETVNSYRVGTTITLTIERLEDGVFVPHDLEIVLGSRADLTSDSTDSEESEAEPNKEAEPEPTSAPSRRH